MLHTVSQNPEPPPAWPETRLEDLKQIERTLTELRGKYWLCRGQPGVYRNLRPTFDRGAYEGIKRPKKLKLERRAIHLFRENARFFGFVGEKNALKDDVIALLVLRQYRVPTRVLDWTLSPWIAAYFACKHGKGDGEIWSFDERSYAAKGEEQWRKWPKTTRRRSGDPRDFDAELTAFMLEEPPDWFVCVFYGADFPRQNAQQGAYSMTARFDRDHAKCIAKLLKDRTEYHRYIIPKKMKKEVLDWLEKEHFIRRGSLFPDTAGAAETVCKELF